MTIVIKKGTRLVYQPEYTPPHPKWLARVGKTCVAVRTQRLKRITNSVAMCVVFEGETEKVMVGVTAVEIER